MESVPREDTMNEIPTKRKKKWRKSVPKEWQNEGNPYQKNKKREEITTKRMTKWRKSLPIEWQNGGNPYQKNEKMEEISTERQNEFCTEI